MEVNCNPSPLWPPPSATVARRRRSPSSPPIPLPILIILLPITGLLILLFVLPPILSAAHHIFRLNSVKKGWDSVNVLLVSFAILCGVFARQRNDDGSASAVPVENNSLNDVVEFVAPNSEVAATGVGRLKRNSSSYPDLRQEALWETGDDRFRFFDDFEINRFQSSASTNHFKLHGRRTEFEETKVKEIPVDTFVLRTSPPAPPPPPPPPLLSVGGMKPIRTYETIARKEKVDKMNQNVSPTRAPPPPPPPPPPSTVVRVKFQSEMKSRKLERRKSNAAKEIKMVLASIYNPQRKRKRKQRTKNRDEIAAEPEPCFSNFPPPSLPLSPPPLPPPSMFHNFFKKGSKSKKIYSGHAPPPPPPPPPAIPSSKRSSKRNSHIQPTPPTPPRRPTPSNTGRPPLPTRSSNILFDENVDSGGQSPLIPMPPPPPPPPFKISEMKFVVNGDFVRIRSNQSSRYGSPELEKTEISSTTEEVALRTGETNSAEVGGGVGVFCPSPDVNVKADTFIARLRDGWRLEKMNSLREKRRL